MAITRNGVIINWRIIVVHVSDKRHIEKNVKRHGKAVYECTLLAYDNTTTRELKNALN